MLKPAPYPEACLTSPRTRTEPQLLWLQHWLLGACACALLAPAVTAAQDNTAPPAPKPALTVSVTRPATTKLTERLQAQGNIAAWQEAVIGSEVDGLRLLDVFVNVGDVVKAGQLLASYATDTLQADVRQAQAGLMEAQANLANAKANAVRAQQLLEQGFLSPQGGGQQRTAQQTAQAQVARAQAALAAQQVRLKQAQVLAPDSGVISARNASVGAVPGRGMELFKMIRQGRLEWRAEVTAAELSRIKLGTAVVLSLASGDTVKGKVRMLAPTVDVQTRNALVYVDLPAMGQSSARAGSFAQGELLLGSGDVLTIAQTAVVRRDGFTYVYKLDADNKVRRLKIQTGRLAGDRLEIIGGATKDDLLVASGAGFLNDGDLVRVVSTKPKVAQ